jgi:hypothetical protein
MPVMRRCGQAIAVGVGAMLAAASVPAAGAQTVGGPASAHVVTGRTSEAPGGHSLLALGVPLHTIPAAEARPALVEPEPTQLFGVYCTSAPNCWAVGERGKGSAEVNEMLHWNGRTWYGVSVANPGGTSGHAMNELYAVRCLNAADCWAVGTTSKNGVTYFAEALHWNGKRWSKQTVPQPGGTKTGDVTSLYDTTCISATNCWAVGGDGFQEALDVRMSNLVVHWNGKRWSKVTGIPSPAGSGTGHASLLDAVRCPTASSCVTDGVLLIVSSTITLTFLNQALHWNGRKWSRQFPPNPGGTKANESNQLFALACGSSKNCWGVGSYGASLQPGKSLNQILHWNGKKWTKSTGVPEPGGSTGTDAFNELEGATCFSSGDCWAIGSYGSSSGAKVNEALRWDGKKWLVVKTPNPGGSAMDDSNTLYAARCTSAANCWAVGAAEKTDTSTQNEILHWNGKKWSAWLRRGAIR